MGSLTMSLSRGARPPRGRRLGVVARALVGALVLTVAGLWGLSTGTAFAVVGYDSHISDTSGSPTLERGASGSLTVFATNLGSTSWVKGSASQVDLANCCPVAASADASWNNGWISDSHYATATQDVVANGQTGTFTFNVTVPLDATLGTHTFPFELVLASTNEALHSEGQSLAVKVVDSTPPVISLTAPAAGSTSTSGAITLSGTAGTATDDSATVTLNLWPGTVAGGTPRLTRTTTRNASTGAFSVVVLLANGFWSVEARQSDASGNTASYVTGWTVAAPSVTFSPASVAAGAHFTVSGSGFPSTATSATVNLLDDAMFNTSYGLCVGDNCGTSSVALTDGSFSSTFKTFPTQPLGPYRIYVSTAKVAISSEVLTITAPDTVPPAAPTVDIVPLYVNAANKTAVQITVSGEVGTTISGSVTSSGGAGSAALSGSLPNGSITQTVDLSGLPDGVVTASVTLIDASSNTSGVGSDTAIKDTVAPAAPGQPCIQGSADCAPGHPCTQGADCTITNDPSPTFLGMGAEPGSTVRVYTNGIEGAEQLCQTTAGPDTSYVCYTDITLPQGTRTFWANATDVAGNTSQNSTDGSCTECGPNSGGPGTVDTTPPTGIMTAPAIAGQTPPPVTGMTPTLTATADGTGSAVTSVQFQVSSNGGAWGNYGNLDTTSPYSGTSTTALAQGPTQARALVKDKAGNTGYSDTISFTVDTTAPTSTITFPASGAFYNAAGWNGGCGTAAGDICGTASDASGSGVQREEVSIKGSNGKYWDGSGFTLSPETFIAATGTTSWSLAVALPSADGSYTVHARAVDKGGLMESGPTVTFTIDTIAPNATLSTTSVPSDPSSTTVTFGFISDENPQSFQCTLDGVTISCTSPRIYVGLAVGAHIFSVAAVDRAGNVDATPATFNWTVALDTDGDGLLDDWETNGVWYNPTANSTCASGTAGCQFINLPAMGALPGTRNIFVQLDWMEDSCHSHRPSFAAIKKVVDAFAAVVPPVRLRVDMGPDSPLDYTNYPTSFTTWGALSKARALTHYSQLGSVVGNQYNWTRPTGDTTTAKFFQEIKEDTSGFIASGREPFFRYAIAADRFDAPGTSGISRSSAGSGGSDFIVSLGAFQPWVCGSTTHGVGTPDDQAGTFMHELGHGLGLGHGGNVKYNNKPNYLSVMSYAYQNTGVIKRDANGNYVAGNFDYSHGTLAPLDETALNELTGLGANAASFGVRYYCATTGLYVATAPGDAAINWNCDGSTAGTVNTDVTADNERNQDGVCVTAGVNGVIDTTPAGDDYVWVQAIRTGTNRVCETAATGDDVQAWPVGLTRSEFLSDSNDWAALRLTTGAIAQPGFRPAPPRQTETDETYTPAEKAKYVKSDITIKVNQGKSNTVNLNQAAVSVGVVSTPTFDARKLVTKSVRFGPAGAAPVSRQDSDFNGDGLIDAVFAFSTQQTGLAPRDTQVCLTGTVQNGTTEVTVEGCQNVTVK